MKNFGLNHTKRKNLKLDHKKRNKLDLSNKDKKVWVKPHRDIGIVQNKKKYNWTMHKEKNLEREKNFEPEPHKKKKIRTKTL